MCRNSHATALTHLHFCAFIHATVRHLSIDSFQTRVLPEEALLPLFRQYQLVWIGFKYKGTTLIAGKYCLLRPQYGALAYRSTSIRLGSPIEIPLSMYATFRSSPADGPLLFGIAGPSCAHSLVLNTFIFARSFEFKLLFCLLKLGFSIPKMSSSLQGLEGLPLSDQILFSQFGRGPELPPAFRTIHEAFENVADQQPNVIAVEQGGLNLSYHDLERAANGLATCLISMGLESQQRVCLVVKRSIPMVIAILAVLKCGCQYVPLDGQVTTDSALRHIIKDTKAPFILCLENFYGKVQRLADSSSTIVVLDSSFEKNIVSQRPNIRVSGSDGAYAIYTSGMEIYKSFRKNLT